jgi:outer membrane protein OmpA-like peptidoglycan-associated protein
MKILAFGLLTLFGWSVISINIWVCKVKGLCNEQVTLESYDSDNKNPAESDSIKLSSTVSETLNPGDLTIYFGFDKSQFESDELTEKYFSNSKTYIDNNPEVILSITGYTDATGSVDYNQALGYRRAQEVQGYSNKNGLQASRIKIESKGENDPAADNNTVTGRANNRRTVITIKK